MQISETYPEEISIDMMINEKNSLNKKKKREEKKKKTYNRQDSKRNRETSLKLGHAVRPLSEIFNRQGFFAGDESERRS